MLIMSVRVTNKLVRHYIYLQFLALFTNGTVHIGILNSVSHMQ